MVRGLCLSLVTWALVGGGCGGGTSGAGSIDGSVTTPGGDGGGHPGAGGSPAPGADAAPGFEALPAVDGQEPDQAPPVPLGARIAAVVLTDEGGGANALVTFAQPF